jgi:nucleotide-binding universal stress UspA family protein
MTILCGIDFSTHSKGAAEIAAGLAERWKEPLVILHSVEAFTDTEVPSEPTLREQARELLAREGERLRLGAWSLLSHGPQESTAICPAPRLTVREKVAAGPPDETLADYALQGEIKLIVVASLGHRQSSRWLLGSVAERTAQTSPVPVLVIRDAAPWRAWLRGERPLRVVIGADASTSSDTALRWAAELIRAAPCDVTVAYVTWPPEERERFGPGGSMNIIKIDPDIEQILHRDLTSRIERFFDDGKPVVRIISNLGRPGSRLLQLAEDQNADLLVVGTHQRRGLSRLWHGSVSRELLHDAPMSVACVPRPAGSHRQQEPIPVVRRVLAATDLSELGNRAVAHAYSVLPKGGVVHLLHVAIPGGAGSPKPVVHLEELIPADAEARGIETHVEVIPAQNVASAISAYAEREAVDLICMGSHGRTGLARVLLGSVAEAVFKHSRHPVMLIRPLPE